MRLDHSRDRVAGPPAAGTTELLRRVSPERLRADVERLAFPRHFVEERAANRRTRDLIETSLRESGCAPVRQGACENIIAAPRGEPTGPLLLLGAHYDSVAGSPGADDNASAVAVCLECARLLSAHEDARVLVVFFNREEDGFLGSAEFVDELLPHSAWTVEEAHIFEMVGFQSRAPHSQAVPPGLSALPVPDSGDFLALLANRRSNGIADDLVGLAATYLPETPVVALKTDLGPGRLPGDLLRSDHVPFWLAGLPAVMWTDTSNFRNPHYHAVTDTPATLDYLFMADVARLALARVRARPSARA